MLPVEEEAGEGEGEGEEATRNVMRLYGQRGRRHRHHLRQSQRQSRFLNFSPDFPIFKFCTQITHNLQFV